MVWGAIAGAVIGAVSASRTNSANAKQADKNRQFQQDNSNTAYQRAMTDMKKAGLNPILAAKNGGASTPAGAMATMQDPITSGINTGLQIQNSNTNAALTKAKTILTKNLEPGSEAISEVAEVALSLINAVKGDGTDMLDGVKNHLPAVVNKFKEAGLPIDEVNNVLKGVQNFLDGTEEKMIEAGEILINKFKGYIND